MVYSRCLPRQLVVLETFARLNLSFGSKKISMVELNLEGPSKLTFGTTFFKFFIEKSVPFFLLFGREWLPRAQILSPWALSHSSPFRAGPNK